jgi:redox-sensitive bicupin YhaK (pirin superfamily)
MVISVKNFVIHKANNRGLSDYLWLQARHTFNFGHYNSNDPDKVHFGSLRVLNDDVVQGGKGFGAHPHENMEIITIPLEGALEQKDSMGNASIIRKGDIQVMSAGTGVMHSEYNISKVETLKLLQIWIYPDKKNVKPRYQQVTLVTKDRSNTLQQILSPYYTDGGVWIYQRAWFFMGILDVGRKVVHRMRKNGNGVYVFVIKGSVSIADQKLDTRDGMGIWNTEGIIITSNAEETEVLVMEVPMNI